MNTQKIAINIPTTTNEIVNKNAKSYLELKQHEFISIVNKIKNDNYSFKSTYKENSYLNYNDLHITLYYSYGYNLIREDKYFHVLDDNFIDINHFVSDTEYLKEYLKNTLIKNLKKYKITESMIDLVLSINLDNFLVYEDGLEFIFSLNQFGIDSIDEVKILVNLKDIYYE